MKMIRQNFVLLLLMEMKRFLAVSYKNKWSFNQILGGNFWGNKFDGSQFDKDIQAIQDYYQNNGYAKARVTKTDGSVK